MICTLLISAAYLRLLSIGDACWRKMTYYLWGMLQSWRPKARHRCRNGWIWKKQSDYGIGLNSSARRAWVRWMWTVRRPSSFFSAGPMSISGQLCSRARAQNGKSCKGTDSSRYVVLRFGGIGRGIESWLKMKRVDEARREVNREAESGV